MKVGQLVLLIKNNGAATGPQVGSVGEVVECPQCAVAELQPQEVAVHFPRTPALNTTTGLWRVPKTWLVPISDPDADITETEDAPIKETV